MATSVHLHQHRLMADPGDPAEYKLEVLFTSASIGFHNELILIKKGATEDEDLYQHICTVGDINRYTHTTREGVDVDSYYRVATWSLFFDSLEELADEVLVQQQKTQYVVTDWNTYSGGDIEQEYDHDYNAS